VPANSNAGGKTATPQAPQVKGPPGGTSVLYAYPVYTAVQLLYRDGVYVRNSQPIIGQIFSDRYKGVPILRLWPLEWKDSTSPLKPLAELWHPALVNIRHDAFCLRGVEAIQKGPTRRWASQKWLCDFLNYQQARARLEPDRRISQS
jgi:hypothetical protein